MKKIFTGLFVSLGVVFLVILIAGAVFFVIDPYNLKPLIFGGDSSTKGDNPNLSPAQEKALETFGIDPSQVPSKITPEQEACFTAQVGENRANQIKAGDSLTTNEMMIARGCM